MGPLECARLLIRGPRDSRPGDIAAMKSEFLNLGEIRSAARQRWRRTRDRMTSSVALAWLRQKFIQFGHMLKLEIDSKKKTIQMQVQLKGEKDPIDVHVHRYLLVEENGSTFLELTDLDVSREWMNLLAGEWVKDKRIKVPKLLKLAL